MDSTVFGPPPGLARGLLHQEMDLAIHHLRHLSHWRGSTENQREEITRIVQVWNDSFASDAAGLDKVAAQTLLRLDTFSRSDEVRQAARGVQNVLVLVCSQGLTHDDLGGPGIPKVLKARLRSAFGDINCGVTENTLSRLGVAKYHIFNKGARFSRRQRKKISDERSKTV